MQVLSNSGSGSYAGIISGLNYVAYLKRIGYDIGVASMSLGGG